MDEQQLELTGDRQPWPFWAAGVIKCMSEVPSLAKAAKQTGVARSTINHWMQKDESLALAINAARQEALDKLEETILQRAREGQKMVKTVRREFSNGTVETITTTESHISDVLAMFYLKRWRPEYRDAYKVEHAGPGGGPIRFDVSKVDADISRLLEEMGA